MNKKRKLKRDESEDEANGENGFHDSSSDLEDLQPSAKRRNALKDSEKVEIIEFDELKHDLCLIKLPKEVILK
jgi:hypothetical protein